MSNYYYRRDENEHGPVSGPDLKALAGAGRLRPTDKVRKEDGPWVVASSIKGLFPAAPRPVPPPLAAVEAVDEDHVTETAPQGPPPFRNQGQNEAEYDGAEYDDEAPGSIVAPNSRPGGAGNRARHVRAKLESQPSHSGVDLDGLLPLIRVKRTFWKSEIVALYDSHAIQGTRYFTELPFTEKMCRSSGEVALTDHCHRVSRIDYEEIEFVREEVPVSRRASPDQSLVHHLEIRGEHQRLRFSLWNDQLGHVREYLAHRLAGRYQWRQRRRRLLFRSAGTWIDGVPPTEAKQEKPPQLKPAKRRKTKEPYRSAPLGWALKLSGLLYWMVLVSPLMDGVYQFILDERLGPYRVLLPACLWAPSAALIYIGYRLCQKPYCPDSDPDGPKPILFLRPFADDAGLSLQPAGTIATLIGLRGRPRGSAFVDLGWRSERDAAGRTSIWNTVLAFHPVRVLLMVFDRDVVTSEETLVRFFEQQGPVKAIGKPGEALATTGAGRIYVPDDSWQDTVGQALSEAPVVVMQPGHTAGVRWELEQIHQRVSPERVLLCMVSFWKEPQAYEELIPMVRQATGIELPRVVPFLRTPAFVYFRDDWKPELQAVSYKCPLLWPLTLNAVDLDYCLRPFLKRLRGHSHGRPRRPRWVEGYGRAAASFASLFVALAIMAAPDFCVKMAFAPFRSSLNDSSWTTLRGRTVPYSLSIPASWVEFDAPDPDCEHAFKSPDRSLVVMVNVGPTQDVSNIGQQHLQEAQRLQMYSQVRLESTNLVEVAGVQWREARLLLERHDGGSIRMTVRAYSDERGAISIQTMEDANGDSSSAQITEKILASVKLDSTIGDDRIVGRWESVNAPVRVIQEFSNDGQSKITFAGTTTKGTYKLDGDIIDWRGGGMTAKVKVKFSSPTEMELSNEAGQRVRYKKIGTLAPGLRRGNLHPSGR